jgi:hypothetical protein
MDAGISIRDRHYGEVEVMDAKLHVVADDVTLEGLINSPCLHHDEFGKELTDQEVYDSGIKRSSGSSTGTKPQHELGGRGPTHLSRVSPPNQGNPLAGSLSESRCHIGNRERE